MRRSGAGEFRIAIVTPRFSLPRAGNVDAGYVALHLPVGTVVNEKTQDNAVFAKAYCFFLQPSTKSLFIELTVDPPGR